MKKGTSSLNPYAASYVPLSRRGVGDVNKETSSEQEFGLGNDAPVWFGHQPQNTVPQNYLRTGISEHKEHGGDLIASTSQYPNQVTEESNSDVDFEMDMAQLQMYFPGLSYDSLLEVYLNNRYDLDASFDMLNEFQILHEVPPGLPKNHNEDVLPETIDIAYLPEDVPKDGATGGVSTDVPSAS